MENRAYDSKAIGIYGSISEERQQNFEEIISTQEPVEKLHAMIYNLKGKLKPIIP